MTGADRLQQLYVHFLADAPAGPPFPMSSADTLFEAWLEGHDIAPDDFREEDWIEFLTRIGVSDSRDQDAYLTRLSEWGGVVHVDREAAAAAGHEYYGMVANPNAGYSAPYQVNISKVASQNKNFRRVLHTGQRMQLVVMSLPPDGEIGAETHAHVEQIIFVQNGKGRAWIGDSVRTITTGDIVVVPAGERHNVRNDGKNHLQLYTVYAPPNHIDGRVHVTRADADADNADEDFGQHVR